MLDGYKDAISHVARDLTVFGGSVIDPVMHIVDAGFQARDQALSTSANRKTTQWPEKRGMQAEIKLRKSFMMLQVRAEQNIDS
jgi:hypothetical protein